MFFYFLPRCRSSTRILTLHTRSHNGELKQETWYRYTYPENSVEDKDEIFDTLNSACDSHAVEIFSLAHQKRTEAVVCIAQSVKVWRKRNYVGCHASEKPPDLSLRELRNL